MRRNYYCKFASTTTLVSAIVLLVCCLRSVHGYLPIDAKPEYVHQCNKSDPQLNECIRTTLNHLRSYVVKGIQEINVPPIEPLIIQKMQMENGHGPVKMRGIFSNMTIYGASNYTVLSVKSDLNKYRVDFGLYLPYIEATGNYDVNGNVLLLPVRSRGEFWASFNNVTALAKLYGIEVMKDGVKFMKIDRLGVGFKLQNPYFKIKDVINRNNVIGEAMNVFLNENALEIIEEMKPAASQAIGKHFKNFLNTAFLQVPLKVWLPDYDN